MHSNKISLIILTVVLCISGYFFYRPSESSQKTQVDLSEEKTAIAQLVQHDSTDILFVGEGSFKSSMPYRIYTAAHNKSTGNNEVKREHFRGKNRFRHPHGQFPVNQLITLAITVDSQNDLSNQDMEFDARMPDHNHGMRVTPIIKKASKKNTWLVEGVNLHMTEEWEFYLTLKSANGLYKDSVKVYLE